MSSYGGNFGTQKIGTPKELVKMLDQYVVGQSHAKKVRQIQQYANAADLIPPDAPSLSLPSELAYVPSLPKPSAHTQPLAAPWSL